MLRLPAPYYSLHPILFGTGLAELCGCVYCRFIACYAQVVNTYVFWGTWSALVLMYWEVRQPLKGLLLFIVPGTAERACWLT
jgi:hypothetical protein